MELLQWPIGHVDTCYVAVGKFLSSFYSTGYEREIKSLRSENLPQMYNVNFLTDPNVMFYYCLG